MILDESVLEELQNKNLYITLDKKGCTGYSYCFSYEPQDKQYIKTNNIFIDAKYYDFLIDAKLFYKKEPFNELWHIQNEKESSSCGCGQSFLLNNT